MFSIPESNAEARHCRPGYQQLSPDYALPLSRWALFSSGYSGRLSTWVSGEKGYTIQTDLHRPAYHLMGMFTFLQPST